MTTVNMLTGEQRMDALGKANRVRLANAAHYRRIRAMSTQDGREAVAVILRGPRDTQWSMRVGVLLRCVRWIGDVKAAELLEGADIGDEHRSLFAVSALRRKMLAEHLGA